jgi:hypothetical protein
LADVPLHRYISGNEIDLSNKVRGLKPGKILAFRSMAHSQTEDRADVDADAGSILDAWLQGEEASNSDVIHKGNASEIAVIKTTEDLGDRTRLTLEAPLKHWYDPSSLMIFANVVMATHGETVNEVLGSGDRTLANQRFILNKPPLTHIRSTNEKGIASTLEVRVNGISWREAPSFHELDKSSRRYILRIGDDAGP